LVLVVVEEVVISFAMAAKQLEDQICREVEDPQQEAPDPLRPKAS
jgi:hypothetical protein